MTSIWFLSLLTLVWVGTVRVLEVLPDRGLLRRVVVGVVVASVIALTFIAYPSDPRGWTTAKTALFLAEPRFDLLAILGSTLAGSAMVGLWVVGIYWVNRRR